MIPIDKIGKERITDIDNLLPINEIMKSDFYKGDPVFCLEPDKDYREMGPGFYREK